MPTSQHRGHYRRLLMTFGGCCGNTTQPLLSCLLNSKKWAGYVLTSFFLILSLCKCEAVKLCSTTVILEYWNYYFFFSQEKCYQYWPNERSQRYQFYVVDPIAEYNMPQYILREFKVRLWGCNEEGKGDTIHRRKILW